jgi:hydroxypyruvate reductase
VNRGALVRRWLEAAVSAVDPEERTAAAVRPDGPSTIVAIGKAAAAMCRGAERALGKVTGVCVTNAAGEVPEGVELLIGDHPLPGAASFHAGKRVLDTAGAASEGLLALISGGGSALCEQPLPGIDATYIQTVNSRLLDGGASIGDTNLVRRHLSAIKAGGVARAAGGQVDTFIVSDVGGAGPEVVASGPTIYVEPAPEGAKAVIERYAIPFDNDVWAVINEPASRPPTRGAVTILADGRIAARAVVEAAAADGVDGMVMDGWFGGEVEDALDDFLALAGPGLTVGAGEPNVKVTGDGVGGRNSHAALLAASRLEGSDLVFAAFATDGVDGRSDGAGAVVDGTTILRGGDASTALERSDSATYLEASGDLIKTGPTGTNVSDLWLLWRP